MPQPPTRHPGFTTILVSFVSLALILALTPGCATLRPRNTLPEYQESKVQVPGMPGVRAWGDEVSEVFTEFTLEAARQERAAFGDAIAKTPVCFLALSGGGDDGAFGAGVLCGWTDHGGRPNFKLVTGISTGALIAPFAFLGSQYRPRLAPGVYRSDQRRYFPEKESAHRPLAGVSGRYLAPGPIIGYVCG